MKCRPDPDKERLDAFGHQQGQRVCNAMSLAVARCAVVSGIHQLSQAL